MEVDLLDFIEQCRRLVKQALGKHAGEPASGGFARWKHDTKTGPLVIRRNADDLLSVAADKAFHNWVTKYEFYALGIEPLILQRGSRPLTLGHNALIRAKGYSQRWMAETSYSSMKRSLGDAVRALGWYRQFREIVLMFAISNIEPPCEPL